MKVILTVLIGTVLFSGCVTHAGRNIREVSLFESKVTGERLSHATRVTFRRDGTAERHQRLVLYPNQIVSETTETARFSTDMFERIAKTIEQNNFFEKQKGPANDRSTQIVAVDGDEGQKSLENPDKDDEQVQKILSAVSDFEKILSWKVGK